MSTGGNGKLASSGGKSASSGGAAGPEKWFLHILLGDGVGTNEAAAKTLWKMALDAPIGPKVRYFLVVLVCAAHTASLATGAVVQGRAAVLGDHTNSKLHEATCGVVARLFKFVLPDYWGEILHETKEWVRRKLVVLSWEQREPESESAVRRLQQLYTKHVISDSCCELLNGGLNPPTHICAPGVDPETVRAKLATRVYEYIVKELYVVDEKPTLTRMFTYRDCVDHCLTLSLLNVPAGCFRLRKNVRQTTQKRLKIILNFFKNQHAPQLLRRTSLGLQITGGVVAMTCKKDESHASEAKRMSCSALLPEDVLSASLIYANRATLIQPRAALAAASRAPRCHCSSSFVALRRNLWRLNAASPFSAICIAIPP